MLLLGCSAAVAQTAPPAGPAGGYLSEFLKACKTGDPALLQKFAEQHFAASFLQRLSAADFAERAGAGCGLSGGWELTEVSSSSKNGLEGTLHASISEAWRNVRLQLDDSSPAKITALGMRPRPAPDSAVKKGMSDAEVAAELKRYMEKLAATDRFSGVVLLAKAGVPLFEHGYGLADKKSKRPNTIDSIFTIGSMGKMFTGVAIGQLVEQGKLGFDDPVGKYLPDYPNQDVREKVTVGMLLTHTSGIGDFLGKRTEEMKQRGVKRATDYLPLFQNDPLLFPPGQGWSYSNAAFVVAGAIIEKVTGQGYFEYIKEHVFKPAGMTGCDTNETRAVPPKMVTPYTQKEHGKWNDREEAERDIGNPAGGSACTAPDLVRFAQALRAGKLVKQSTFAVLSSAHSKDELGTDYGYGFDTEATENGHKAIGHAGGFNGVSTILAMFPEGNYDLVVFSNYDPTIAETTFAKVAPMLLRK